MKRSIGVFIIILLAVTIVGCTELEVKEPEVVDLTTWDEQKVYDFMNEVQQFVMELPYETPTKEEMVERYERYFSTELSEMIVDSLYIKQTDTGWQIPDGDGGYMFWALGSDLEGNVVTFDFQQDYIKVKETFEIGMYSFIEYTIRYQGKPVITEWVRE